MEPGNGRDILLVDDDDAFRSRVARALVGRGFIVREAAEVSVARAFATEDSPELALVDLKLRDGSGLDVVSELKAIDESTRIVVLTGYGSIATAVEAMRRGAFHYLTKPVDVEQIVAAFTSPSGGVTPTASVPTLEQVEWEHLQRVLADCGGNISHAARALKMHRRSLQRKLARMPKNQA